MRGLARGSFWAGLGWTFGRIVARALAGLLVLAISLALGFAGIHEVGERSHELSHWVERLIR